MPAHALHAHHERREHVHRLTKPTSLNGKVALLWAPVHSLQPGCGHVLHLAGRACLPHWAAILGHDHARPGRILLSAHWLELVSMCFSGSEQLTATGAHPTDMALVGMSSESLANMPVSDSRPFARLMSDTCSAPSIHVSAQQHGGSSRCRTCRVTHRDVVAHSQLGKIVRLVHLPRAIVSLAGLQRAYDDSPEAIGAYFVPEKAALVQLKLLRCLLVLCRAMPLQWGPLCRLLPLGWLRL